MAKNGPLMEFECDRCGYKDLTPADEKPSSWWQDVSRIDADGTEKTVLMCGFCFDDYRKRLANRHDTEFKDFMRDAKKVEDKK